MREIKFRAWDIEEEVMCRVEVISLGTGCFLFGNSPTPDAEDDATFPLVQLVPIEGHFVEMEDLELMQFNGLPSRRQFLISSELF
jgi:hypothetical protein